MLFPSDEEWSTWGIADESHKFFFLRWQEILDENTADTWQLRFSNIKTILNELLDVTDVIEEVPEAHKNLFILLAEAREILSNDIVINQNFKHLDIFLTELENCYKNKIKEKDKKDCNHFRRLLKVLMAQLDSYRDLLFDRIIEILKNPPKSFKKELYALTMSLGVELKSLGYSVPSLQEILNTLCANESETLFSQ